MVDARKDRDEIRWCMLRANRSDWDRKCKTTWGGRGGEVTVGLHHLPLCVDSVGKTPLLFLFYLFEVKKKQVYQIGEGSKGRKIPPPQ